jgi:hypothetical protein
MSDFCGRKKLAGPLGKRLGQLQLAKVRTLVPDSRCTLPDVSTSRTVNEPLALRQSLLLFLSWSCFSRGCFSRGRRGSFAIAMAVAVAVAIATTATGIAAATAVAAIIATAVAAATMTAVVAATAIVLAAIVATFVAAVVATAGLLFAAVLLLFTTRRLLTGVPMVAATETSAAALTSPSTVATATAVTPCLGLRFQGDKDDGHDRQSQSQTNDIALHQ